MARSPIVRYGVGVLILLACVYLYNSFRVTPMLKGSAGRKDKHVGCEWHPGETATLLHRCTQLPNVAYVPCSFLYWVIYYISFLFPCSVYSTVYAHLALLTLRALCFLQGMR